MKEKIKITVSDIGPGYESRFEYDASFWRFCSQQGMNTMNPSIHARMTIVASSTARRVQDRSRAMSGLFRIITLILIHDAQNDFRTLVLREIDLNLDANLSAQADDSLGFKFVL